jgi:hypothetical protein
MEARSCPHDMNFNVHFTKRNFDFSLPTGGLEGEPIKPNTKFSTSLQGDLAAKRSDFL